MGFYGPRSALTSSRLVSKITSMTTLLAPLEIGDQIAWKLDRNGDPQWLTVTEALSDTSYAVSYPDGTVETLTDSE